MAEFIDRMSVVCAIKKYELEKCPSYKMAWVTRLKLEVTGDLLEDIMGIPVSDVVEVVRCEKCNQFRRYTKVNQNFGVCRRSKMEVSWHDFCSYGEREDGT